jgi:two-component system cell cycle sensor histidine kinase PleC
MQNFAGPASQPADMTSSASVRWASPMPQSPAVGRLRTERVIAVLGLCCALGCGAVGAGLLWQDYTEFAVGGAAVAALALIVAVGLLVRQIHAHENAATAFAANRRALETAQAVAHIGSWVSGFGNEDPLLWSAETFRIFGVDPKAWHGTVGEFYALIHADDHDAVRAASQAAKEGNMPYSVDHRICRPDGSVRWVHEQAEVMRSPSGAALRLVGTVQDITEQKLADEALRLSEARLRDYLDTASDGYWETGPDHRFTYLVSRIRSAGFDYTTMLGKRRIDLAADTVDEAHRWAAHLETLERHEPFREFVYQMQREDGATSYLSVSGKPVFSTVGEFQGYRGTTRNVTAMVAAEEKMRDAKIAAETASAAKSAFLANMSHELRTPLNAVIGFAEVLNQGYFGTLTAKQAEYVSDIRASGNHLLTLINDLLDLAKIEAGKLELDVEPLSLAEELDSCLRLIGPKADESRVRISTHLSPDLPRYPADKRAIKQVLLNLLSNAVKFTPAGGLISVAVDVDVVAGVRISIRDTGIGIASADIPKIVKPFGSLGHNADLSRRHEGTGLGLPLSKSLVEMHGGRLEIESEVGHGTTATVLLPPPISAAA